MLFMKYMNVVKFQVKPDEGQNFIEAINNEGK